MLVCVALIGAKKGLISVWIESIRRTEPKLTLVSVDIYEF